MEQLSLIENERSSQDQMGSRHGPGAMPLHPSTTRNTEAWLRFTDIRHRCVVGATLTESDVGRFE